MGLSIVEPKERLLGFKELEFGVVYVVRGSFKEFKDFNGSLCQRNKFNGADRLVMFNNPNSVAFDGEYLSVKLFQELPNGSVINYTK